MTVLTFLPGVIPRAAQHLFESLNGGASAHSRHNSGLKTPTRFSVSSLNQVMQNSKSFVDKGWEMSVTYVEIYNEHPRDLLLPEDAPFTERANVQIREDPRGRIFVEGLNSVRVSTIEDLMRVLNHGSSIRQTDATAINARSSRSHAVFTINLRQTKAQGFATTKDKRSSTATDHMSGGDAPMTVESKLHFVDLAGSERLKNTGATGDRAREGISINAGLASLGKVIAQLSSRSSSTYVSYRDSKLTRMLQDSLGGNAITYMIACVTPAEFHLSETLNTVQYAQRARNIQSKPKIQQVDDGADKQAVIERLRTEIAFLRQQIRSAETSDRRPGMISERVERSNDRENELHNQLLDVQESYNALSQRHAKLVSELTKSSESLDQVNIVGESAVDRLKRSQANQDLIEQVVMEYEKTIQSLETNLSNTRSSLATTESNLLEKETKCAYTETMNQQLNARVQKLMDRESNTEQYLHDLEAKLDDQSSGGEKNDAIISDLRKEITRIRESETNAEDYICTLEERLAESDQDMEIMQREVERLQHLVERQRSLGKLDNLLYELDHIQDKDVKSKAGKPHHQNGAIDDHEKDLQTAEATELPAQEEDELEEQVDPVVDEPVAESDKAGLEKLETAIAHQEGLKVEHAQEPLQSPAQSKFITEKFESVSQELFDLRLEHESTVNELDLLSAKYQEALRTLAEMQDSIDDDRQLSMSPPQGNHGFDSATRQPFLEENETPEEEDGQQAPSSRSLSAELSLAGESSSSTDTDITPVSKKTHSSEVRSQEIEKLQNLLSEHERNMKDMTEQYTRLQEDHKEALTTVDRLKSQIKQTRPSSPGTPGMLRRMTSQSGNGVDRGQRSVTSLRTLMAEEFESKPDRMETAEVHLTAANTELQARLERIHALEAEVKNAKKEMEIKSTIISGLTRERTSIKAGSPVDLNMVSQLRDQIIQKETELKSMHEGYARREQELQEEIQRLSAEKAEDHTPPLSPKDEQQIEDLARQLEQLQSQLELSQQRVEEAEKNYASTKSELEVALASIATLKAHHSAEAVEGDDATARAAAANAMQAERDQYEELVDNLKRQLEEQQTLTGTHAEKNAELQQLHAALTKDYDNHTETVKLQQREISALKGEISDLQQKIKHAEAQVQFHKHGLKSLHDAHASEIEEMKLAHGGALAGYDDQLSELTAKQEKLEASHKRDLEHALSTVQQLVLRAQTALGHPTTADMLATHIQDLVEEKQALAKNNTRLTGTNGELERQLDGRKNLVELEEELENAITKINNYQETIRSLANEVGNHEETIREKDALLKKAEANLEAVESEKAKKLVLIEELEQQLQNSFDQHHNRLSVIQAQGNQALIEAQQRIATLEQDLSQRMSINEAGSDAGSRTQTMKSQHRPQSPLVDVPRSNSMTSNLRKSASIASLPSPPPSMPLPPLPAIPGALQITGPTPAPSTVASNPSPPQSRHASKEVALPVTPVSGTVVSTNSRDRSDTRRQSVLLEEQENRLRTIEKHLHAEKQLTATLEEALVDLETQSNKLRVDAESWKKKAWAMEEELAGLKKEKKSERLSVQAVEEEVKKRREAEAARAQLEERMRLLTVGKDGKPKKKKGSSLNCF
jgi:chromosome segregation ATPase